MPSSTFASTIHPHAGAYISKNGTGMAKSQPATSSGLRPVLSAVRPAYRFASAFVKPNVTMNESTAVSDASPNTRCPTSGNTSRSIPTIDPTNALTATSSQNCVAFAARPKRTRPASADKFHFAAGGEPLGRTEREAGRVETPLAKHRDGLVGKHAVRPAAVHDVALRSRQCDAAGAQRLERRAERTGQMRGCVFLVRTNVEQCCPHVRERIARCGERRDPGLARAEVRFLGVRDGRIDRFRDGTQLDEQSEHRRAGRPVMRERTATLHRDEAATREYLEMLRRVRDREAGLGGEILDRTRPLRNEVEQLEPMPVREGRGDACAGGVHGILEAAFPPWRRRSVRHIQEISRISPGLLAGGPRDSVPSLMVVAISNHIVV